MKNFIKSQDKFGHPVVLSFKGGKDEDPNDTYRTIIGGVFSILLRILYIVFFVYFSFRMFVHADNKTNTVISPINWK